MEFNSITHCAVLKQFTTVLTEEEILSTETMIQKKTLFIRVLYHRVILVFFSFIFQIGYYLTQLLFHYHF